MTTALQLMGRRPKPSKPQLSLTYMDREIRAVYRGDILGVPYDPRDWTREQLLEQVRLLREERTRQWRETEKLERKLKAARTRIRNLRKAKR